MSEAKAEWWVCCWGHVFRHVSVDNREQVSCTGPDEAGVCGTTFVFEPFPTEQAAVEANADPSGSALRWAPWVR